MFNLNAGWIQLKNTVDYGQVVNWFKQTDIDPREIILLFKELYITSTQLQANHVRQPPKVNLMQVLQNSQMMNIIPDHVNINDKHREAKEAMRGLLEIINAKYVAELRKDPSKPVEFIHSKYSFTADVLNVDDKFPMKDILSLVQTALMKMYIEADMQDQIHSFFSQISN